MVNVLFVCLGNICRSPSAEGVLRHLVKEAGLESRVRIDSAGTAPWQVGRAPDRRALMEARRRGIDLSGLRARMAEPQDFYTFEYILAMDRKNLADLKAICPLGETHRLALFLSFVPGLGQTEVPDPYYGNEQDFVRMFDLIEMGVRKLLGHFRRVHF